ncbi:MAG: alpha/beta fold hydrolase [Actinomycetota bacterium]|nr:alpha/beta fold hydrolase [Actinomycetota bacterium]
MTEQHLHAVIHDGDGPPALLLHGALGSRSYWDDNIAALRSVCSPVVLELWGHGRSPSPEDPDRYQPAGYVEELEWLRNELGGGPVWLIGQSMGAALTMHYTVAHPENVIGLVITNSSSGFADAQVWQERNRTMVAERAAEVEEHGVEILRDSWINPGRSKRISEEVRVRLDEEFSEHGATGIIGSFRHTNYSLPLGEALRDIQVPTLLTNGIDEERFQLHLPRVKWIPDIEIVELPASHAVNAHDPQGWNEAAVEFIGRHTPPSQ